MSWERDHRRVSAVARSVGCAVTEAGTIYDGEPAYRLMCESPAARVKLLDALAWEDSHDPNVRRIAERVMAVAGGDRLAQLECFHEFVKGSVAFANEPTEMFSSPLATLQSGIGDCDDSARLLAALLRSVGIPARLETLGNPPVHVATQGKYGDDWLWLETTVAARLGEHPITAANRLGIRTRPDLV